MPREIVKKPRFIYPQIATSLSIASVSALAELLFWRILPQADDQGRLPGDPRQLKAIVCPMREELTAQNIPELLTELEKAELIIHYSNSSIDYIQIAKWWDYQGAMRRIFPSQYPPPEGWKDIIKDVSVGQPPTTADKQHPEEEEEVEREKEIEPEREKEVEVAPPTTAEKEIIKQFTQLKGWQADEDDVHWLQGLRSEYPGFTLAEFKACVDYYSGRALPKHKGIWKNRFRNWMIKKREFEGKGKGDLSTTKELKEGWKQK